MNILNIDLDFFLNKRIKGSIKKEIVRADNKGLIPWNIENVNNFLKNNLFLKKKIQGKYLIHHDEVFEEWRKLISFGALKTPFKVTHIDAHSDLGMGTPCLNYLLGAFLDLTLEERAYPMTEDYGCNLASYMSFAIGNRWISQIDFVVPDCWHDDIPRFILDKPSLRRAFNFRGFIKPGMRFNFQLSKLGRNGFNLGRDIDFNVDRVMVGEPKIPFEIINYKSLNSRYLNTDWDFIFLCQSPQFTPSNSDKLIPLILDFISEY